jgi:hypothetical protein
MKSSLDVTRKQLGVIGGKTAPASKWNHEEHTKSQEGFGGRR